ncbi:MAG: tRNA (adenosine(37)-N6)-dimethylallyltransferase MiaA [Patescibacteria group bacterium]|nr:tRNA (adenosine(37)-N6)-dimethylallyltransferase MiaA [Patescibacteria group bacterium]MDE2014978.1 tRNA (adenosine(37)-N6)-dimethylallyltransferase MiaA [Patescibacteria group bacterium]MDE2226407.1 tRNA (adenosine(37)-N6)-dimethylallyltransferase MiaA [Patescibacteria group bacterium]
MSSNKPLPKILVVVGPTASGKSSLAIKLARKFNGEIISADSRQVYRGMDIGTGKVSKKEMSGIPHHLLSIASPKRIFTAAHYQKLARQATKKIINRGRLPIVVGGTGLYMDALLYDYPLPKVRPNSKLRSILEKRSAESLFSELEKLDGRRAKTIDRHNKRRLIRALEIISATGKPVPRLAAKEPLFDILKIGLNPPDNELRRKIATRLRLRLKRGMIAEVKRLLANGVSSNRLNNLGLEYRFVSSYLKGSITKEEMLETLEKEIIRYAKRQMTWFRKGGQTMWIKNLAATIKEVKDFLDIDRKHTEYNRGNKIQGNIVI